VVCGDPEGGAELNELVLDHLPFPPVRLLTKKMSMTKPNQLLAMFTMTAICLDQVEAKMRTNLSELDITLRDWTN
jgi:hypothetical protein